MSHSSTTIASPAEAGAAQKPTRRVPWMLLGVGVVLLALLGAATWWFLIGRWVESTDDAYVGGNVTVMAPKVSGFVADVRVHDNQFVHAGQVLITLDASDYDARRLQAQTEVDSAEAAIVELAARKSLQLATINQRQAEVQSAGAELARSGEDRNRYRALVKDQAVSDQLVERADADQLKARAAIDSSKAALVAAQRALVVFDAQIVAAQDRVATAKAALSVAVLNVGYTTIRAPIDGYVANRTARVGMLADVGLSLLTVVPASGLWVDANFKEDQLKRMHVGDKVDVSLDAADGTIQGVVESLAPATGATFSILPPENATGNFTKIVQRVPVRIRLNVPKEKEGELRAGLSSTVTVHLQHDGAHRAE